MERIVYTTRFEEPYWRRRKMREDHRMVMIIREKRIGPNLRMFQTVARCNVLELKCLIDELGRFPHTVRNDQPDFVGMKIDNLLDDIRTNHTE